MKPSLSIRAYTKQLKKHVHDDYHQLVLPIQGSIHINTAGHSGPVTVGECVVIPAGIEHAFKADEMACFIVADLDDLPLNMLNSSLTVFSITTALLGFIQFVEKQLNFQVNSKIEASMLTVFCQLLEEQDFAQHTDTRIRVVLSVIVEKLDQHLTINELAKIAYLSPTQFKKRFKETVGTSVHKYITLQRMERAKALLTHTDLPVQVIAERVGYSDISAFSRRFSAYVNMSPSAYSRVRLQ